MQSLSGLFWHSYPLFSTLVTVKEKTNCSQLCWPDYCRCRDLRRHLYYLTLEIALRLHSWRLVPQAHKVNTNRSGLHQVIQNQGLTNCSEVISIGDSVFINYL